MIFAIFFAQRAKRNGAFRIRNVKSGNDDYYKRLNNLEDDTGLGEIK
jgi:hypothetical protein